MGEGCATPWAPVDASPAACGEPAQRSPRRGRGALRSSLSFAGTAVGVVAVATLGASLLGGEGARRSTTAAGALTLATLVPASLALRGWRSRTDRFLAALATGFAIRGFVLLGGVVAVVATEWTEPLPFVVALGGFTIGLAFAEPLIEYRRTAEVMVAKHVHARVAQEQPVRQTHGFAVVRGPSAE